MQFIKSCISITLLFSSLFSFSQSTYLQQGSRDYITAERLEIKAGTNENLNYSGLKPINRKVLVEEAQKLDSGKIMISETDRYNLRMLYMNNNEWYNGDQSSFQSRKPILKSLYKTQVNLLEVNKPEFFLALNPVIQYQQMKESNNNQNVFLNSRGIVARGLINKKIGFFTYVTDNQERAPGFVQRWEDSVKAVPGAGFLKAFKANGGYDFFDARGYITFNIAKYVDLQFGYDRNFIGDGYRSLFLSDFSNNYLFLKLNTRIWKFNYQNLFMELTENSTRSSADTLFPKKYAVMHHLSFNATKWLRLGLFESVIFGRKDHFDFAYLNPIIFYRSIEQQLGSFDNANIGFDFKANMAKKFQFYGQILFDEFILKRLKVKGAYENKYALQLGGKYIDAFGIPNLDLQLEGNIIRPFVYSHFTTVASYTHYNQPLAHPAGANLREMVAMVRYQPIPKLFLQGRIIYYQQGVDSSANSNFGANIFKPNGQRAGNDGYFVAKGAHTNTCLNATLLASYEIKPNIFIDANLLLRNYKGLYSNLVGNTNVFSLGVRMNMHRREYNF
jgi:hypothetical protein